MPTSFQSPKAPIEAENARDLQATLYREIGISAVAAALRFTTQPEPVLNQSGEPAPAEQPLRRTGLAA